MENLVEGRKAAVAVEIFVIYIDHCGKHLDKRFVDLSCYMAPQEKDKWI